jgi:hypothetical protein
LPARSNSLQQRIWQGIFFLDARNSANSAQKQQVYALRQGKAQGFQGISDLSASQNGTYRRFSLHLRIPGRELAGNFRSRQCDAAFLATMALQRVRQHFYSF